MSDANYKKLFPKKEQGAVSLTLEQSEAMYAYACSVGNGQFEQGGSTRRVRSYVEQLWLFGFGLMRHPRYKPTEDDNRLECLPDGTVRISSSYAFQAIYNREINQETRAQEANYACKFYLEQVLRKNNETGKYELIDQKVRISFDPAIWNDVILPQAHIVLSESKSFTDKMLYNLIPCLCDDKFRVKFCEKLANGSQDEIARAREWIGICFKDRQQELDAIEKLLPSESENEVKTQPGESLRRRSR